MSVGSAAQLEQAGPPSEITRASGKIVAGRRSRMKRVNRKKSRPARILGCVIAAAALSGCNAAPLDSAADDRSDGSDLGLAVQSLNHPGVVPPDALPEGLSLAQWSALWWQQILAIPFDRNPVFDTTGQHCAEGASEGPNDNVWFLAGTPGGSVTRRCRIPTNTRILFPLVNTADDNNSPTCTPPPQLDCSRSRSLEACLTRDAHAILKPDTLFATVDGRSLNNLFRYVQTSDLFFFSGDPSLIPTYDSCITGGFQEAVAYGWWIMLEPLPAGPHTLTFGGTGTFFGSPFNIDVTYHLIIGP